MSADVSEPHDNDHDLRRRAEEALDGKLVDLAGLHVGDIQYVLHELQVHQAELVITEIIITT